MAGLIIYGKIEATSITENGSDIVSRSELAAMPNLMADPGWRDMLGAVQVRSTGPTSPTWTRMGTSPFYNYAMIIGQEFWTNYHLQHDYQLNSGIFFHVHFTTNGTNTQPVRWQFEYTIAKGHDQSNFNIDSNWETLTVDYTPHGTAWRHYVAEIPNPVYSSELEPDSVIQLRVSRISNGATNNTDTVFVYFADVHYLADRTVTKNRAPNFYV